MTYDESLVHVLNAFKAGYPDEGIDKDSDFFDLGGDSLTLVNLCLYLSEQTGLDVHPSMLLHHPTVGELASAITDLSDTGASLNPAN